MHKRITRILNDSGTTIAKLIETCLLESGIDKVLTITVDNASANKVSFDQLRSKDE